MTWSSLLHNVFLQFPIIPVDMLPCKILETHRHGFSKNCHKLRNIYFFSFIAFVENVTFLWPLHIQIYQKVLLPSGIYWKLCINLYIKVEAVGTWRTCSWSAALVPVCNPHCVSHPCFFSAPVAPNIPSNARQEPTCNLLFICTPRLPTCPQITLSPTTTFNRSILSLFLVLWDHRIPTTCWDCLKCESLLLCAQFGDGVHLPFSCSQGTLCWLHLKRWHEKYYGHTLKYF